jgi:hypothetical protein
MTYEYFGDVDNLGALLSVLKKYDEEQMLQYEPFSRTQMCDEIRTLCVRFKQDVPAFIIDMLANPDEYTLKALKLGYSPCKPLIDEINDDYNLNISNPTELRDMLFTKSLPSEATSSSIEDEDSFVKDAFQTIRLP